MADDDKQIEIKKRARRRLVGAAALALFAVIVLPMVMDGEPRPVDQDIQVRIPPAPGEAPASRLPELRATPQAAVPPPEPAGDGAQASSEPQGGTAPPVASVAAPSAPSAPEPARPKADEGARAAAILAGQAPAAGPRFVVQIGAYRDRSNAQSLQDKLKSDGFAAYTEKLGDKTRVRIGPYPDRAEAEAALARVKRLGLGGSVMTQD